MASGASRARGQICLGIVATLTVALTAVSIAHALDRYQSLNTGWSWDLAYYNQWLWALTRGDGRLTVRPIAAYATEGPMVWQTNYLAPVRLLLVPVYYLAPGPKTLLVVHSLAFWLVVPAAFTLARAESGSDLVGLAAATLVPFTPLLWPLAWNDFRELQMAIPFVLWSVQGVRSRNARLAALGIAGVLACRQEFAAFTVSLAVIPARGPEDVGRTYRWVHALIFVGLAWFLFGFFGYLRAFVSSNAPTLYLSQFEGEKPSVSETLKTAGELLALGLGAWVLFLGHAPRVTLIMLPWLWNLAGGRWSVRFLSEEDWHHVRYAAPFVATGLAAAVSGFGRFGATLEGKPWGLLRLAAVWLALAGVSLLGLIDLKHRMDRLPPILAPAEAREVWTWIDRVGPDDGVLACYEVSAPLSSRRLLYSYVLDTNKPRGYPTLPASIGWVFYRNRDGDTKVFERQGFERVYRGRFLTILRRAAVGVSGAQNKIGIRANNSGG